MSEPKTSRTTTLIATAGHVDHGKTSLVRSLTGIDTDRLPEEKAREISIECGFAHATIDGESLTFVDVPGHERFIRQMVGGVSGMDAALLVIAADDGPMPQTLEHLDICTFVGIPNLVVALTRADLVEAEWLELMLLEVQSLLETSPWPDAIIVPCSSVTGLNIDRVGQALADLSRRGDEGARRRRRSRPFAMPIDRVFSLPGFGTVVTGTSLAGEIRPGDAVIIAPPGQSDDGTTRVRNVERQGEHVEVGGPAERLALNLVDIPKDTIARGAMAFSPGSVRVTRVLEVWLHAGATLSHPLKRGQTLTIQAGLATADARVFPLSGSAFAPGEAGPAELRLDRGLPSINGMPFVLRGFERLPGRGLTVAGGIITDGRDRPAPSRAHLDRAAYASAFVRSEAGAVVEALLKDAGPVGFEVEALRAVLASMPRPLELHKSLDDVLVVDGWAYAPAAIASFVATLVGFIETFHRDWPGEIGFPSAELEARVAPLIEGPCPNPEGFARLIGHSLAVGAIARRDAHIARPDFVLVTPAMEATRQETLSLILRDAGLMPPWRDSLAEAIAAAAGLPLVSAERYVQHGLRSGEFVRVETDLIYHRSAIEQLLRLLDGHLASTPELTIGDLKELTGASRKWTMPLVAWLDKERYTTRKGEVRTRHPRWSGPFLPSASEA